MGTIVDTSKLLICQYYQRCDGAFCCVVDFGDSCFAYPLCILLLCDVLPVYKPISIYADTGACSNMITLAMMTLIYQHKLLTDPYQSIKCIVYNHSIVNVAFSKHVLIEKN